MPQPSEDNYMQCNGAAKVVGISDDTETEINATQYIY